MAGKQNQQHPCWLFSRKERNECLGVNKLVQVWHLLLLVCLLPDQRRLPQLRHAEAGKGTLGAVP